MNLEFNDVVPVFTPIFNFIKNILNNTQVDGVPIIQILLTVLFLLGFLRLLLRLPGNGSGIAVNTSRLFKRNNKGE